MSTLSLLTPAGEVVATEVEVAQNPLSRFLGLMGRGAMEPGKALLLEPCNSIHMAFMRFPIDVLFLSADGVVLKAAYNVRPWLGMAVSMKAKRAIEFPAGSCPKGLVGARLHMVEGLSEHP